ncbi:hypothetical protein [Fusobacterium ulcerans]|uniref:hypothetical protein n=1 Tax=Fusobacterium ulcerans TaxID=861 RepID=UPI00309FC247
MSILKEKVINKYSLNQLKEILPQKLLYYFMNNKTLAIPPLYTISQYIDLDYINYTPSDLKKDYKKYSNYKEIETVFNILKQGHSVNEYLFKSKVDQDLILKFKNGFWYNSKASNLKNIINKLVINYDISNFKIEFYKEHIELYGDKELLEAFKNTFNLQEGIYYEKYKSSWHLAFSGLLADYITYKEKKDED